MKMKDIKQYNLRQLCARLEKLTCFKSLSRELEQYAEVIFRNRLEKISAQPSFINQCKKLENLNNYSEYLPETKAKLLESEIRINKKEIESKFNEITKLIGQAISLNQDEVIIKNISLIQIGKGPSELIFTIQEYINKISSKLKQEILQELHEKFNLDKINEFLKFFEIYKELYDFNRVLINDKDELGKAMCKYFSLIMKQATNFVSIKNSSLELYLENRGSFISENNSKIRDGNQEIDELNQLISSIPTDSKVLKFFLPGLIGNLFNFFSEFYDNLYRIQTDFVNSTKKCIINFDNMKEALYNLKRWDIFFKNEYFGELFKRIELISGFERSTFSGSEIKIEQLKELLTKINKIYRFETASKIVSDILEIAFKELKNLALQKSFQNSYERKQVYQTYNGLLKNLSHFTSNENIAVIFPKAKSSEFTQIFNEAIDDAKISVKKHVEDLKQLINSKAIFNDENCQKIDTYYSNFEDFINYCYEEKLNIVDPNDKSVLDENFKEIIEELSQDSRNKIDNASEFAEVLIKLKRLQLYIKWKRGDIQKGLDNLLLHFKEAKGLTEIGKLGIILNQKPIGKNLVQEHSIFDGYETLKFNKKIQSHKIGWVIDNLEGSYLDKLQLTNRYNEFISVYEAKIEEYLRPGVNTDPLIEQILFLASNMKVGVERDTGKYQISKKQADDLPELIALVFALWTLNNASNYFKFHEEDGKKDYLFTPHPAQVIAIFRIIGIGDSPEVLRNNLVQVLTGEGKSIILGVSSIILTLLGFDVYCACYSSYLSDRDFKAFLPYFSKLKVADSIKYGTFSGLCEKIINEKGDIRKLIENMIIPIAGFKPSFKDASGKPKVLLVDEVDVFFSPDFYGNLYNPAAIIKDPSVTALINHIWSLREEPNLDFLQIEKSPYYKPCKTLFDHYYYILDEAIKDMINDLKSFNNPKYVCRNGKIAYKELDEYSYYTLYGYKTLFAYYCEHEKGNVSEDTKNNNIYIKINVGSFSYAEIPLKFQYIMGVTGTLKTLTTPEKKIVQEKYKVTKETYLPSVFGSNNLKFDKTNEDVFILNETDYYMRICQEIKKPYDKNRPVLVFFENEELLNQFLKSNDLDLNIKDKLVTLTEKDQLEDKTTKIKTASYKQRVTLLTKPYGRGTDFVSNDDEVNTSGGVHVIQTFLSEQESEEVQIRGRTARQGQKGSYCLVVQESSLEKFLITKEEIASNKGPMAYKLMNSKRNVFFENIYNSKAKFIESIEREHKLTEEFFHAVSKEDLGNIKEYLLLKNSAPVKVSNIRVLALLDGTRSMGGLLEKFKNSVSVMFTRARSVLTKHKIDPNCFLLQICIYRNYDCGLKNILVPSAWETKPESLRSFMSKIKAKGGGDSEDAIEIGLWHAYNEHLKNSLSQVMLITDAPAKSLEQVTKDRICYKGEKKWNAKYGPATYFKTELDKLKSEKIKVNTFYINGGQCETNLKEIANLTGGNSKCLPINTPSGEEMLVDFITEEILKSVGRIKGNSEALLTSYSAIFPKKYT